MQALCWAKNSAIREIRSRRKAPCSAQVIRYSVRDVRRLAEFTFRFTRWMPPMPTSSGPSSAPAHYATSHGRLTKFQESLCFYCISSKAGTGHGMRPNLSLWACLMANLAAPVSHSLCPHPWHNRLPWAPCFQPLLQHALHSHNLQ